MTPATPSAKTRHDTLDAVTARSGRGTARQTIRVDEGLWERFGEVAKPDRSAVLRDFIRWYVGEDGAPEPRRSGDQPEA